MQAEDIRRLAAAVRGAGEDFFCAVGPAPSYEALIGTFGFAEDRNLLLLPGDFTLPDGMDAEPFFSPAGSDDRRGYAAYALSDNVIAADVRLLGDAAFRSRCRDSRIGHFIVPFAELADPSEYGGRRDYGWIGEFRAELPCETRVTALFSQAPPDYGPFRARFGSHSVTAADAAVPPVFGAHKTANVKRKYAYTLALAEKYAARRTAVFFINRREAEEFRRFLLRRGIAGLPLNGGMSAAARKASLEAFMRYEGLLTATKYAIPSALFFSAEQVLFCGVPYSAAFTVRCASFSGEGEPACCFCRKDIETDIRILKCFAESRPEEERETFLLDTMQRLLDVKRSLV